MELLHHLSLSLPPEFTKEQLTEHKERAMSRFIDELWGRLQEVNNDR